MCEAANQCTTLLGVCVICADLKPSDTTLDILAEPPSHAGARGKFSRLKRLPYPRRREASLQTETSMPVRSAPGRGASGGGRP
jgi:hypothetical protein